MSQSGPSLCDPETSSEPFAVKTGHPRFKMSQRQGSKRTQLSILKHQLGMEAISQAAQIWESCIYTAEDDSRIIKPLNSCNILKMQEERDFVRDHLGPALEACASCMTGEQEQLSNAVRQRI